MKRTTQIDSRVCKFIDKMIIAWGVLAMTLVVIQTTIWLVQG